jgi:hypothetical protein
VILSLFLRLLGTNVEIHSSLFRSEFNEGDKQALPAPSINYGGKGKIHPGTALRADAEYNRD